MSIKAPALCEVEKRKIPSAQSTKPKSRTQPVLKSVGSNLQVPWALAFAPDGRLFVTERAGRIRVIQNGRLLARPWRILNVVPTGEMGLLGIALAPDFVRSRHIYVVGTFRSAGKYVNRVIRLTDVKGQGVNPKVIVDNIPAGGRHAGDAVAFGPDGMLYVATGDARQPWLAQDKNSLAGKILRYRPDGTIPRDNPFSTSPIYALGLRNPQGLAWDSATKTLFATDHGPSGFRNEGGRRHHDELNVIRSGANYGWPIVAGTSQDKRFIPPLVDWTPAIAPAGLVFSKGSLFVGGLKGQQVRRVVVQRTSNSRLGWRVVSQQVLLHRRMGRIRAVTSAPDGSLYLTTSNRDQISSQAFRGDDHIYRFWAK